jgi:hypothetical protein
MVSVRRGRGSDGVHFSVEFRDGVVALFVAGFVLGMLLVGVM